MRIKKSCLACGEAVQGRADKKFCGDDCRANYNNSRNRDKNNLMRRINRILRQNRRILQEYYELGKTEVHKNKLMDRGFQFSYFTNIYYNQSGQVCNFCYEKGLVKIDDDYYNIIQQNDQQLVA